MKVFLAHGAILGPHRSHPTVRKESIQFKARSFALFTKTPWVCLVSLKMPQQKKGISILNAVKVSTSHA